MNYINVNELNVLEKILAGPDLLKISIVVAILLIVAFILLPFNERVRDFLDSLDVVGPVLLVLTFCGFIAFILTSPAIAEESLEKGNIELKYELPEDAKVFNEGTFWKVSYIDEDLRKSVKFKVKLNDSGEPFDYDSSEMTKKMIAKVEKKV